MRAAARVVFLGNDHWSVPTLERLASDDGVDVILVVTNPPRPAGRGSRLTSTPVAEAAHRLELPLAEEETTRDERFVERLRDLSLDVAVVVAYGELLASELLHLPRLGSMNLHFSLLPRWRGASPVQHAILAGDPVTGVSVIQMDEGLDTGPVLARREVPIRPDDSAGSLGERLARVGAPIVLDLVDRLAAGADVERTSQQALGGDDAVTIAPKLRAGDRIVNWSRSPDEIVRHVRAFAPEPGANTTWRTKDLKVLRAETSSAIDGEPGTIVAVERDGVVVAAGGGAVRLLEIALAGRRRMPSAEWARGARDVLGDRLGA